MARKERTELIRKIQELRGSKLITYVSSTRSNVDVPMAIDVIRKFYEHLKDFSKEDKINIDLLLVSNGGDGIVPWRLVTLIREYADKFSVLIPYRAFSAATLTALGADTILMHPMGMLGPTDPTVSNHFNPVNNKGQIIGISVEDVSAFISLIKEDAGITHQDELVQAFNKLADKVHPLALGNVKRSLSQSKMMAQKLLALHMNKAKEQHEISEIVDNLTSKLYYHGHPINRHEAKEIGLKTVEFPDAKIEDLMWQLFLEYDKELKSEEPYEPALEFIAAFPNLRPNESNTMNINLKLTFIESERRCDYCESIQNVFGTKQLNGSTQVMLNVVDHGWRVENDEETI